nr:DNA repair protein RadC [bacterium]
MKTPREHQPYEGHRERTRQRYLSQGIDGLLPEEVLELLISCVIPRQDVKPIGIRLIERFGSLDGVLQASIHDLQQVAGVGPQTAMLLSMILPVHRAYEKSRFGAKPVLSNAARAARYARALSEGRTTEDFYCLSLDAQYRLRSAELLHEGTIDETAVYPREVVQSALRNSAQYCMMVHNHPGAGAQPSPEDYETTERVQNALLGIGIILLDHIVVSDQEYFSFFDAGVLDGNLSQPQQRLAMRTSAMRMEGLHRMPDFGEVPEGTATYGK